MICHDPLQEIPTVSQQREDGARITARFRAKRETREALMAESLALSELVERYTQAYRGYSHGGIKNELRHLMRVQNQKVHKARSAYGEAHAL